MFSILYSTLQLGIKQVRWVKVSKNREVFSGQGAMLFLP
jgi:hypothetical protein